MSTKKIKRDNKWIILTTISAFLISGILSVISELIVPNGFFIINIILVLIFIIIGIIFDIIGVAITTGEDSSFHSMSSKKIKGSEIAVNFINNKDKVSSFCNDVVGDICGVLSGSGALAIAIKLSADYKLNLMLITVILTALITALTIGGKAIGKTIAVNKSNEITFKVAKILSKFK
jgi:hypothetical protein